MTVQYTAGFKKQYKRLPEKLQASFDARLLVFVNDPSDVRLRNHPLRGNFAGYWSINITGDLRALYRRESEGIIIFALIGTHSQLYGK